ncbi:MAG: hypothetical protein DRO96_01790 [Candidatus Aenigmatarchaeota archaeon]|nr:MAG: hypothetical protein DRO96_01790 [Candidatus Aenigmarchaeota archaeon]RLJ04151.1 MAG: hypothetical protein DRP08_02335 [Candidatus Aenigmarchaeota archaeon]
MVDKKRHKKKRSKKRKETRKNMTASEVAALENIRKLAEGYKPKTTKTGTKFKGKNKVIIA